LPKATWCGRGMPACDGSPLISVSTAVDGNGRRQRVSRSWRKSLPSPISRERIEWSSRTETVATFGEGVEPLSLGRLPGTRLREILGGQA
jgi:hypothetical protein